MSNIFSLILLDKIKLSQLNSESSKQIHEIIDFYLNIPNLINEDIKNIISIFLLNYETDNDLFERNIFPLINQQTKFLLLYLP